MRTSSWLSSRAGSADTYRTTIVKYNTTLDLGASFLPFTSTPYLSYCTANFDFPGLFEVIRDAPGSGIPSAVAAELTVSYLGEN